MNLTNNLGNGLTEINYLFQQQKYQEAQFLCEQMIEEFPDQRSLYWYLGLSFLLQENEAESQTIWFSVLLNSTEDESDLWTKELVNLLKEEITRQKIFKEYHNIWLIRQYIQEFAPDDLDNILELTKLSINLDITENLADLIDYLVDFTVTESTDLNQFVAKIFEIIEILDQEETIDRLLQYLSNLSLSNELLKKLLIENLIIQIEKGVVTQLVLSKFCEYLLLFKKDDRAIIMKLVNLYQDIGKYLDSESLAQILLAKTENILDKIAIYYLIIRGWMKQGGNFHKIIDTYQEYERLISEVIEKNIQLTQDHLANFIVVTSYASYLEDQPSQYQSFRNRVSAFCQQQLTQAFSLNINHHKNQKSSHQEVLKIGYISSCLHRHSVGYLSRWLFQHHDRERFQIYVYSFSSRDDLIQNKIVENVDFWRDFFSIQDISEQIKMIQEDEIDILVDLDSLTSIRVCTIMALKLAPIQITWLGFDASGLPNIDYFIADNYVLPDNAQTYYKENIWRLPNTYIAVDGFEIGIPNLRREQLDIPDNAIIYFSSQAGYKRHPDNIRCQIQIIKQVPNSYFLIKGLNTDIQSVKPFFESLAQAEGLDSDRLRFLPSVPLEADYRANLKIADIVLDTYPYNGATTTLETLWMEIPIVTRVGEQFAARNSYTMMINAGITEGIAWSDEEYIEWGVSLGLDEELRKDISWKLRKSKQTSPLWNGKQFAREMEKAYLQMWENYCHKEQ